LYAEKPFGEHTKFLIIIIIIIIIIIVEKARKTPTGERVPFTCHTSQLSERMQPPPMLGWFSTRAQSHTH
jgi:hypothetical protein